MRHPISVNSGTAEGIGGDDLEGFGPERVASAGVESSFDSTEDRILQVDSVQDDGDGDNDIILPNEGGDE